jgi:hypothetical protein
MSERQPCPVIVGVSRSGTTLLRLMIDAHPNVAIPAETHFLPALKAFMGLSDARTAFLSAIVGSAQWSDFGLSRADLEDDLSRAGPLEIADCVRRFYGRYAALRGKSRWGDKTPAYVQCMQDIHAILPESRFIHIVRDGRDVALSMRGLWFGVGDDVQGQARRWVSWIRVAQEQARALPHYCEVRYETLLAAPRAELARVCDFVDLDFSESMLHYHATAAARLSELQSKFDKDGLLSVSAERRRNIHSFTHVPPDESRAGRWKKEMSVADQRAYESVAGGLLRELGYETRFG